MLRHWTPGLSRVAPQAFAVLAAVAVGLAGSPLPRITPDSAVYLTGAEQLSESGSFAGCERPITEFAPGYSVVIAGFVAGGLDAPDGARMVNLVSTAVLVLAAAWLGRAVNLGRNAIALVALATAVSAVTLRNGAAAWSEPLFCALLGVLLFVVVNGGRGLEVRLSGRLAVTLALFWALCLTRYSGLFALPAVALAAWLGSKGSAHRTLRVAAFSVSLLAVPAAWSVRNLAHGDGPFGSRSGSEFSVSEVLRQVPGGLSSVVLPVDVPLGIRLILLVPLVLAAFLAFRALDDTATGHRLTIAVLGSFAVVYVAAVTLAATRTLLDPVDARLLSPVLAPGAILVAVGVAGARRSTRALAGKLIRYVVLFIVACATAAAPAVVWYLHSAERTVDPASDVSCAEWPARYASSAQIRVR